MSLLRLGLVAATLALVCGQAAPAVAGGTKGQPSREAPLPVAPAVLTTHGMEVLWQTELLLAPKSVLNGLWLCGDWLVGLSSDNRVHCTSAVTGVRLWSEVVAGQTERVWPPTADKTTVWVPTTTKLLGFNGSDGRPAGRFDLGFSPAGRPATNGTHVFIPDSKGWLQAVSVLPKVYSWGRWTEDSVTASPTVDATLVYFGSQDGVVYASAQNVRRVVWEYKTEGPVVGDLKRTKTGLVLVPSLDYTLYAFAGPSGRLAWRYNAGEPVRKAPYAIGNQVYVLTRDAGLTALDASNGKALWRLAEGVDVVTADATTVYVLTRGGDMAAVARADGKPQFAVPLAKDVVFASNETDSGILYLATRAGQVLAAARKRDVKEEAKKEETTAVKDQPAAEGEKKEPAAPQAPPASATPAAPEAAAPAAETPAASAAPSAPPQGT